MRAPQGSGLRVCAAVGTFVRGFDRLVREADAAAAALGVPGIAQIGHSAVTPRHLEFERFVGHAALQAWLRSSHVLICHGGMGLLGEGLRAGCHLIVVPRQGATTRGNPANDQAAFCERLAWRFEMAVCTKPGQVEDALDLALRRPRPAPLRSTSNAPALVRAFLSRTTPGGAPS